MKGWNCVCVGDYPKNTSFCVLECQVFMPQRYDVCVAARTLRYPLEAWRLVALRYAENRWVRVAEAKHK